jgi:signal transduction histidine kinase/ligand-binding sensor domain-containing protein/AraC-like DNA-binding protein
MTYNEKVVVFLLSLGKVMEMRRNWAIFFMLLGISFTSTGNIIKTPAFRSVSPPEGFTYGGVQTIAEDKFGLLWFGTLQGLYSYDTESFKKYLHHGNNDDSPPGNNIRNLFCDSSGKMWISTSNGFCYYDSEYEKFIHDEYSDNGNPVNSRNTFQIFEDKSNQLWIIDQRGLAKADTVNNVLHYGNFNPPPSGVNYAKISDDGTIWLGSNNGTIYYSVFPYDRLTIFGRFKDAPVLTILPVKNEIWIGYDWNGVIKAGYDGNVIAHYSRSSDYNRIIPSDRVRDIYQDRAGRIWLATYKGLSIIHGNSIVNYDNENYPGVNHNSAFVFFEDSRNGLWLGTWSGGLYYMNMHDNNFFHIKDIFHPVLNTNVISSFTDGPDNTVWVGTESGLLFSYDVQNQQYETVPNRPNHLLVNSIKTLYTDSEQNIWIGTYAGGIWLKQKKDNKFLQLEYFKFTNQQIYAFAEFSDRIYIATGTSGIHAYSMKSETAERYTYSASENHSLSNNSVRCLLPDSRGNLWAGTMNGLNVMEKGSNHFKRFNAHADGSAFTINNNEIFSLHEDRHGYIWAGTGGGGLNRYDPYTGKFEYISEAEGLAGKEVYGILEDNSGNLWLSTENGISMYDPRNRTARNFIKEDGLQGNQFNPGASYKSRSGFLFFGGSNGFTCFQPATIRRNPLPPLPMLTSIAVNHEELKPAAQNSLLNKSIKSTSHINLKARENSLTLSFVANNYLQPQKNSFRYRLVNYDERWIEAGSERKATFTQIPPGKYVFELMASNNDGIWSTEPAILGITIMQPLFLRWYAILAYLIVIFLISYFFLRELRIRQKLRLQIRDERLQREHEEEVIQMKMQFLTNITHELKTPLSLILSPASHLYRKYGQDTEARFQLDILMRNASRLKWLVSQVIDLRKIDMNKLDVSRKPVNVVKLCHQIMECFLSDALDKSIKLSLETAFTESYLETDPDKLDIIITNLVSNAMKFTPENGEVTIKIEKVSVDCKENAHWKFGAPPSMPALSISVTDNGPGIAEPEIPLMFERFSQGHGHQNMGTGIGLSVVKEYTRWLGGFITVSSGVASGTSISICFPWQEERESHTQENIQKPVPVQNPLLLKDEPELRDENVTVLIVEDDADTRNYMANLVKKYFKVLTATNGKQGYEKAVAAAPDIIISDVIMPGSGGFEMTRILKDNVITSKIPVIIVTAQNDYDVEIESIESGARAFITKPFAEDLLVAHLRKILLNRYQETVKVSESAINEQTEYSDHQLVEKAVRLIEINMHRPDFGIDLLSSGLNISRATLYRKMKLLTGQSATEFIRYIRLKKALSLMESGNLSIEEISMIVGFNSHSYFSHCFRQHFGKTPTEYLMGNKQLN